MREADKIDGETGPVEPGVKGNLTLLTNTFGRRHRE
jgi:hypothetical protein